MKAIRSILTLAVAAALVGGMATSASAETLGWSETGGKAATSSTNTGTSTAAVASTVNHRGASETKVINGTTNKRSHGWTTWSGVYHYTRARLELGSTITSDSGRVWGTSGTEAISPWTPPTLVGGEPVGPGSAKTYYGN